MNNIIIFCASYLYLAVVVAIIIAWLYAPKDKRARFIMTTVLGGLVALALALLASHLYYDPRPFVVNHITPLIPHAADNGFPSDHALFTMTLTAVTYFFNKKLAYGMLVLTIVVGVARVLAGVHSPLDIGAAWVIASIGAVVGYYLVLWLYRQKGLRGGR